MLLSVIVPTHNRAGLLLRLLTSLTRQEFASDSFEVIVVDNGSTDSTKKTCESFGGALPHFRYLYEDSPGLHVGRHLGCEHAKGEILVYADDDIQPYSSWLTAIAESFTDPQVAMVGGKILPEYESEVPMWAKALWSETPWGAVNSIYSLLDFGDTAKEIPPEYVFGCNFSIRKTLLEEIRGFHPDAMPIELLRFRGDGERHVSDMVKSRGLKAMYNPAASVSHWVSSERLTLEYVYKRSYAEGITHSYSHMRTDGGLKTRRILANYSQYLRRLANNYVRGGKAGRVAAKGYFDGYAYHRGEVKKDLKLRDWVLRDDYREASSANDLF